MAILQAAAVLDRPEPRRPDNCPVEDWLAFLGHRWNALILWHLQGGAKRHGELSAVLPAIAPKVLTERLDGLEKRGLITRTALASFPRSVSYSLSAAGRDLVGILDQIELWSRRMPQG
ncbi:MULTISPECIES: helix-turn-helix domain-containing protein [unclassified Beijerinckia]|uniref:winged helix-turn-helix transcriptional regulator n=1 Tax=unclassified Beijerinckia TaxID=2638183 RepID=UPI0008979F6F|nr:MULTISPECIES: helix-turn-helix domain-containing protein [unclassified Beijerinckia]MDH7796181.1 DNA-binding HxlR family transcriptional regulator [Beijerinckia sp. GAS462]SEC33848.1 transcriptional regulator, HxlR family [Beijerinckia sp. 28-YEA-48]